MGAMPLTLVYFKVTTNGRVKLMSLSFNIGGIRGE